MNASTPDSQLLAELQRRLRAGRWTRAFGDVTLERGRDYARKGRVGGLRLDRDGGVLRLSAEVSGTEDYYCEIFVPAAPGAALESECECPVGISCKHAAALLFVTDALVVEPRDGMPEWERWIAAAERPAQERVPTVESGRQLALLLQRKGESPLDRLLVQAVWARPLRSKQGFGAPIPLHLEAGEPLPRPAGGFDPEIQDQLAALLSGQVAYSASRIWVELAQAHQERALEALMREHVAYWEKLASTPLSFGPRRHLDIVWQEQDDGSQRLVSQVEGLGVQRPLRARGLWYHDPQRHEIGRLDGDAQLLPWVEKAPRLRAEDARALQQRLAEHPRLAAVLASPQARRTLQTLSVAPRAVLLLHTLRMQRWGAPAHQVGAARLLFDYAGFRLPAEGALVERRLDGERLVDLRRDMGAEHDWRRRLAELRLIDVQVAAAGVFIERKGLSVGEHVLERSQRELATPEHWLPLLSRLTAQGFVVEFSEDFPLLLETADGLVDVELREQGNWFDLSLGVDVGGQRVDLLPLLRRLIADPAFPLKPGPTEPEDAQWILALDERRHLSLPLSRLRGLIEPLLEWLEGGSSSGEAGALRLGGLQAGALAEEWSAHPGVLCSGAEGLRARLAELRARHTATRPPEGFGAELRPYQREGLGWLDFLAEAGLGGLLADDMGLGKTVQVLAHLLAERQRGRLGGAAGPALVVCPTSLVGNWRAEAARFAPQLTVLVLHGAAREASFARIAEHDMVITTYPLLPRDRETLIAQTYALLVLDEAQQIKNARTQAAQVVRALKARRRLALTGTPLENHLGELWAQFDAVEPGLLGGEKQFQRHYRNPIEQQGDVQRRQRLQRRIAPLMLRRRKEDVLGDLPPRSDILRLVELEGPQRELYESLRLAQHERVREAVAKRGLAQSGIVVLDALLKLRQVCCDPRLVKLQGARKVSASAKLALLLDLLRNLMAEGRRVLVFSQFTEMLDLIAAALRHAHQDFLMLTGQTQGRAELVQRFQAGEAPIFLISLKAGGVGLNLTAADTVIHYDPWWNPAVEAQATDRAHRIGQDKPVFVYRLICAGTVEEKIQALQARKGDLARAVLEGGSSTSLRFDETDLEALFAPVV